MNFLLLLLGVNLATLAIIFFYKNWLHLKQFSLISAFIQLILATLIWFNFDYNSGLVQYNIFLSLNEISLQVHLGIDGLGLYFIFLSVLLLPVSILCAWVSVVTRVYEFNLLLHAMTFMLILVFSAQDLLLFYIAFESILIPMFFIVGVWGSRERKIHAAYQFFLYTLIGSILMFVAIIYMYTLLGSVHVFVLLTNQFDFEVARLLWVALFMSFAVKVPMIPFHIWLPEAHVEAPTAGSVILAGILLKMGTYGLLKFSLPIFPEASLYFQPLIYLFSLIGIVYSALTTLRQVDLKKVIAYSSVGHMNYVTLGIASGTYVGLEGSLFMMIGHGFVSSALFLCIGSMYDRFHTRIIPYYGGLFYSMPLLSFFFLFFTLANVSMPGTSNFIGEILIFLGIFIQSSNAAIISGLSIILSAGYSFWLYNRVTFSIFKKYSTSFSDLNSRELTLLLVFVFFTLVAGLVPSIFLEVFHIPVTFILDRAY